MGCYSMPIPDFKECESLNQRLLVNVMEVPDNVRKVLRLLAKQFEIIEVYKEPDIYLSGVLIQSFPFMVKYRNFNEEEEFEFNTKIYENGIKYK